MNQKKEPVARPAKTNDVRTINHPMPPRKCSKCGGNIPADPLGFDFSGICEHCVSKMFRQ